MRSKQRVTHRDVAARAGVSTAVVSYVINDGPRPTSPEVRERVLRAIHELDYHPNAMARGLRARRTNTIGLIIDDYSPLDVFISPYSARILTGLTAQLKSHGYYVLLYPLDIDEEIRNIELLLRSGRLDGVVVRLVQDPPDSDALLEMITRTGVPCVTIERPGAARFNLCGVSYDDQRGAYEATSYLIARGHRRIAYLNGDPRYASARGRLAGYRQALLDHGLPLDTALICGGDWDPAVARQQVGQLWQRSMLPTALFAASDNLAMAAIDTFRARGLRVPEDVAVIGFDDIDLASEITPALTTVRIPLTEIGRRAADLVVDQIESPEAARPAQTDIVPFELVVRAST
jgi:LacI family transcriptional regulator